MNWRNILLVITLILSFVWWTTAANTTFRIFNGERVTDINQYAYMAALYENQIHYICAGAVVTYHHVVTAARCVHNKCPEDISVKAGVANLRELGELRIAYKFHIPNGYDPTTQAMGVAVVEVHGFFTTAIRPIKLWGNELPLDSRLEVSGWGLINEQAEQYETELRTCSLFVKDWGQCLRDYRRATNVGFSVEHLCAENRGRSNICHGDFGAPGVVAGRMFCAVAVASIGCGQPEYPAVFIDIGNEDVQNFLSSIIPN